MKMMKDGGDTRSNDTTTDTPDSSALPSNHEVHSIRIDTILALNLIDLAKLILPYSIHYQQFSSIKLQGIGCHRAYFSSVADNIANVAFGVMHCGFIRRCVKWSVKV